MQARLVSHHGGINRIRCMPQQPPVTATWGDHGRVQLWDLGGQVRALGEGGGGGGGGSGSVSVKQAPLQIFSGHKEEGFAMDWSPVGAGRLVTGDCAGGMHLWEPGEGGKWVVDPVSFKGHTGSIEDLQWSPSEMNIVASCSADQRLMIWDTRAKGAPGVIVHAHEADENVLSWNRRASCMIATGSDDGSFRIWDLRQFKGPTPESDACVAKFSYHQAPITAIEWSPHDESMLATSSIDNQLTIWDLALERDKEEEAVYESENNKEMQAEAPEDLPPQLLFVHQGQSDLKELHWHPQIPGMLLSTAKDGFNAFQPSNL